MLRMLIVPSFFLSAGIFRYHSENSNADVIWQSQSSSSHSQGWKSKSYCTNGFVFLFINTTCLILSLANSKNAGTTSACGNLLWTFTLNGTVVPFLNSIWPATPPLSLQQGHILTPFDRQCLYKQFRWNVWLHVFLPKKLKRVFSGVFSVPASKHMGHSLLYDFHSGDRTGTGFTSMLYHRSRRRLLTPLFVKFTVHFGMFCCCRYVRVCVCACARVWCLVPEVPRTWGAWCLRCLVPSKLKSAQ